FRRFSKARSMCSALGRKPTHNWEELCESLPSSALRCSGALGHDSTEKGGFARFFGRYFAWAASYFGTLQLASFSEPARQRTQDFNPDGDYTMDQSAKEEKYFLN